MGEPPRAERLVVRVAEEDLARPRQDDARIAQPAVDARRGHARAEERRVRQHRGGLEEKDAGDEEARGRAGDEVLLGVARGDRGEGRLPAQQRQPRRHPGPVPDVRAAGVVVERGDEGADAGVARRRFLPVGGERRAQRHRQRGGEEPPQAPSRSIAAASRLSPAGM